MINVSKRGSNTDKKGKEEKNDRAYEYRIYCVVVFLNHFPINQGNETFIGSSLMRAVTAEIQYVRNYEQKTKLIYISMYEAHI